jgi:hypothetical protein
MFLPDGSFREWLRSCFSRERALHWSYRSLDRLRRLRFISCCVAGLVRPLGRPRLSLVCWLGAIFNVNTKIAVATPAGASRAPPQRMQRSSRSLLEQVLQAIAGWCRQPIPVSWALQARVLRPASLEAGVRGVHKGQFCRRAEQTHLLASLCVPLLTTWPRIIVQFTGIGLQKKIYIYIYT